ncbi:unannotated protein [freshwater metagenome]|uniref:Unannotated protein n=1 Tax=freshwater metagenome TaxID=449393 RepID=A0A6J7EY47_9ZZZZ|nr:hypothetical protein [Actinomycetota bacterium]
MRRSSLALLLPAIVVVSVGAAGSAVSSAAQPVGASPSSERVLLSRPASINFAALPGTTDPSAALQAPTAAEVARIRDAAQQEASASPKHSAAGARPAAPPVWPTAPVSTLAGRGTATGWQGLSHFDQRTAADGNQFSTEPPDTELCGGGGKLLEMVNTAVRVYNTNGSPVGAVKTVNALFGAPLAFDRTADLAGPDSGDVKCVYDPSLKRFFATSFMFDTGDVGVNGVVGGATGRNFIGIAVSKTSDPSGDWWVYLLDGTNDGANSTPSHAGCPCLPDQPLIGTDAYGFYVTTNEFGPWPPDSTTAFLGAQIYAFDKQALAAGTGQSGVLFAAPSLAEDIAYSVQPQKSSSRDRFETKNNGTAYFMSALDFFGTTDNRIAVWALTGTKSLSSNSPSLRLSSKVVSVQGYASPEPQTQKNGPTPLRKCLKTDCLGLGFTSNEALPLLDGGDDRMAYAVLGAKNSLWGGLNTGISQSGKHVTGVAWFNVKVGVDRDGNVTGSLNTQGYTAVQGEHVSYPSIAVSDAGRVVMGVHLMGRDHFPSAGYVDLTNNARVLRVSQAGTEPLDGFSAYLAFGSDGVGRMGDYAGAVAIGNDIFTAVEDAAGGERTVLANWSTFITKIPG